MSGIQRLDIKQLRVLEALLIERNLSRVAAQMGLTQQAISEQLRKLRALFNDELFVRQGNTMVPTPLAIELGRRVSSILSDMESLLTLHEFTPSLYEGVITISATDYAIDALLPQFLKAVRKEAPLLKIIITDFESDNVGPLLTSGELDFALTFPPFVPDYIKRFVLFDEQHICVASVESPMQDQSLSIADIAALPQLVISPSKANLKGSHDEWFAKQGLKRNIVMSIPSFKAAPDILYTTDMIAFYPSRLLPNPKVKPLNIDINTPKFEVIAAWHTRTEQSQIHQWVLAKLREVCSE
ncbi:LysR family transcriptional regulator [Vibrio porteresiae]|uniref:LysR family transcriptional regulator n=1 Tax=Vibrio porteresiae DSM 19223 TaxID=1123496 RepID=A0ABZ0QAD9_9VIBR|nr:LysR family transcriptional regulator [Vibrio porteresiae]WPC73419.1 LysR family transcriptional regulator [Vibrio porteresiae DSM 19223]